ncbi:unnamed protein product [Microthlaspi erraticum]|uniref:Uncharacterized protein n=1 Tax=Microthlaspi erraticum TaxID=1685480 RepID=A0A6D2JBS1_9BRAS|nr:unnamed protein product [Microthlaspi erraticum]
MTYGGAVESGGGRATVGRKRGQKGTEIGELILSPYKYAICFQVKVNFFLASMVNLINDSDAAASLVTIT